MPEESKSLIVHNLKLELAHDLLNQAISSSNDISGAVFLPSDPKCNNCIMNINETFKLNDLKYKGSLAAIRVEGTKESVDERIQNLINEFKLENFQVSVLGKHQSEIFWTKIRNLEFFSLTKNNIVRISIPPSKCVQLIYQIPNKFKYYLDWGGALIWMEACELTEEKFESIKIEKISMILN